MLKLTTSNCHRLYKLIYNQRISAERIDTQVRACGTERSIVRDIHLVRHPNTLIYLTSNVCDLD